mgnify:CR=1 FL=1
MAILLDTSFLIAFDNEKDVHHIKARELWIKIKEKQFGIYFISDYIFDEVISVTMRKKDETRAKIFGKHIKESLDILNIDSYLFEEAWNLFEKREKLSEEDKILNFTDCTNVVLLEFLASNKIATFDRGFEKIDGLEIFGSEKN